MVLSPCKLSSTHTVKIPLPDDFSPVTNKSCVKQRSDTCVLCTFICRYFEWVCSADRNSTTFYFAHIPTHSAQLHFFPLSLWEGMGLVVRVKQREISFCFSMFFPLQFCNFSCLYLTWQQIFKKQLVFVRSSWGIQFGFHWNIDNRFF